MKVLLLHASIGWGHKKAAEALQQVFSERGIETACLDLLDYLPPAMSKFYTTSYAYLVAHLPWLWRQIYDLSDRRNSPYAPARSISQKWQFERLLQFLQRNDFTDVICTHYTPAALALDWRQLYGLKYRLFSVITDYASHRYWKRSGLDHYFVATEEVLGQLGASGIPASQITVSGIPISPQFQSLMDKEPSRSDWCSPEDQFLVLVLTSGLNDVKTHWLIEDLRSLPGNIRFLVSAGKHAPREQQVAEYCQGDPRFTIFGFSSRIPEMMHASDVLVSKPGGLTVSEALAARLPEVLFSPIPGQEEANADFLVRQGAAVCIRAKKGEFKQALNELLSHNGRLSAMAQVARNLGKPDAAQTIVNRIVSAGSLAEFR
jgi:processive 1,2-diacylglycerol beta-glucosyltransferase